MQNKRVNSISEVDFSGPGMPCIAVYKNPEDFPGQSVARIYDLDKPTDTIIVRDNPVEIAEDIRTHTGMVFIPRRKEDVPSLIGVWI
jgi:hypothetical protein